MQIQIRVYDQMEALGQEKTRKREEQNLGFYAQNTR